MTTKRKQQKSAEKPRRLPPIVIVPDKSYIDDTGHLITTDVIVLTNQSYHAKVTAAIQKEYGSRKDIVKAKLKG